MKIAFYTLGCKVNAYETASVWELFEQAGYELVHFNEFADVYIINTCTVTNNSDSKSRKMIRKAIKTNPDAIIAVMGCYAQMDPETVRSIDGVDIVIGTKHREKLLDLVRQYQKERKSILDVTDVSRYRVFDEIHVTHFAENTRAFLKIEDGCDNFCTYCIIPFARGRVRSRNPESVLSEARELVHNGYKEIVLTGIHTGGYGSDLEHYTFTDLLRELSTIKGLQRLRISSIEINEITDEMLFLIKENSVFARHLHIPLQSGSDEILRLMKRKYDKEKFKNRITEIRDLIPGIAITTDIIVGFPSESEQHFQEMYDFIKEIEFSEMHIFPYSRRSGTKAALMPNQIDGLTKSARVKKLLQLNNQLANKFIKHQKTLSVLFETSDDNFTYGHSDNYIRVKINKNDKLHNQILDCKVVDGSYKNIVVELL